MLRRPLTTALPLACLALLLSSPLVRAQNPGTVEPISSPVPMVESYQDSPHSPSDSSIVFEVASIRLSKFQQTGGEGSFRSDIAYASDGLNLSNVGVDEMIQWAFGVQHFQVSGGHLLRDQHYDVRARATEVTKVSTLRLMLQNLLITRFGLRFHWEQRRTAVYEMLVDRDGPKLPENKADEHLPSHPKESLPRVAGGDFVFTNVTLPEFADQLTELRGIALPVVDRTDIQGIYDITLKSAARAILDSDEFTLPDLIRKQLGLKLVSAKDPFQILVVDHIEKPSPN